MALLWDVFRFGFLGLYLGFQVLLLIGLFLEYRRSRASWKAASPASPRPLVSVIVPARNEAGRIGILLDSLRRQDYPALEFIFINDRSTDATGALLADFARSMPKGSVRVLELTENPGPNFKQYGLLCGYGQAKGDFILFTDADCLLAPGWATSMVRRLEQPGTGLVIGPVFKTIEGRGFFSFYQAFDHAIRYFYLAATTGLEIPAGGFGNNMIFRKAVLDGSGGYAAVPYSVTEDAALISLMRTRTASRIRAALDPSSRVMTLPVDSQKEMLRQALRWNNGGLFAPDPATRFGFSLLMVSILACVLTIPFAFFVPGMWIFACATFAGMIENAVVTAVVAGKALPPNPVYFILSWLATPFWFALLTLMGLCGIKVQWKDAKLPKAKTV